MPKRNSNDEYLLEQAVPVTIRSAAQIQLETSIRLWFAYASVISIHTLAAAANGCYHAAGGKNYPGLWEGFVDSLSRSDRRWARMATNFLKHGPDRGIKLRTIPLLSIAGELLMFDAVILHEKLFGEPTPLMLCFVMRFAMENGRFFSALNSALGKKGANKLRRYNLAKTDRPKFLETLLPVLPAHVRASLEKP